jgi:glyceraldehyde-3-phosphate dehydrogenase (NADP+)
MGNTIVFKPPKLGVLLHEPLLPLLAECFPPGVVNTAYGDGRTVIKPLFAIQPIRRIPHRPSGSLVTP